MVETKFNYYLNHRLKPKVVDNVEMFPILMHFRHGKKVSSVTINDRLGRKIYASKKLFDSIQSNDLWRIPLFNSWGITSHERVLRKILNRGSSKSTKAIILEFKRNSLALSQYLLNDILDRFPHLASGFRPEKDSYFISDLSPELEGQFLIEKNQYPNVMVGLGSNLMTRIEMYIVVCCIRQIFGEHVGLSEVSAIEDWRDNVIIKENWNKVEQFDFSKIVSDDNKLAGSTASILFQMFRVEPKNVGLIGLEYYLDGI